MIHYDNHFLASTILHRAVRESDEPAVSGGAQKILIVDDNAPLAEMLARILRRVDFECDTALTAEQACTRLEDTAFDVVITDVDLGPGMDGWTLIAHVRATHADQKFVVMSGYGELKQIGQRNGSIPFIHKPFRNEEVRHVIQGLTRSQSRARSPHSVFGQFPE